MSVYELDKTLNTGARENRFRVSFTLPAGVPGDVRELSLLVTSTNVPGKTKGTITIQKDGKTARMAGDMVTDETFPCTFRIPRDTGKVYGMLYSWYELEEEYKVIMKMEQLDVTNATIATWELSGVWLSVIAPISMNSESQDTIATVEATLTLDDVKLV